MDLQNDGLLLRGQSTVIEHASNECAVHQNIGSIGAIWGYTVELDQNRTVLTIEVEYSIPIPVLGKLAEDILLRRNAREFELALKNVKETMEA